jgi:hypothetical protein
MNNNIKIIGEEEDLIYYSLNKQIVNIPKILISKNIIVNNFESKETYDLFIEYLTNPNDKKLTEKLKNLNLEDLSFKEDFYKLITEFVENLNGEISNFELKNYNFMNFTSNLKFNIVIRNQHFSLTKCFIEKSAITNVIKKLLLKYFKTIENFENIDNLSCFQIEIFESFDLYKTVFLKKENNNLILSSVFGYYNQSPVDLTFGNELYFSVNEKFNFFENKQNSMVMYEQNNLKTVEINKQSKILKNEELMKLNEKTREINDLILEIAITKKEEIKIISASFIDTFPKIGSDEGFFIHKSQNNYNKISIISLRDDLSQDTINPKYLILRNSSEISEMFENLKLLRNIDGIIFVMNFYLPILEIIGKCLNIDIIYSNKKLPKCLEAEIDLDNFSIKTNGSTNNPFENIIPKKEENDFLENLNLDLNPQEYEKKENNNQVENIIPYNNFGKKKSAISILADEVLNKESQEEIKKEEEVVGFDLFEVPKEKKEKESSGLIDNLFTDEKKENIDININVDINKYLEILATKIYTKPNIKNDFYFVDETSISYVQNDAKLLFFTQDLNIKRNENLNYVFMNSSNITLKENDGILINSINDFENTNFDNNKNLNYFINLTKISYEDKISFIKNAIEKYKKINLFIKKEDLDLIENFITNVNSIFIPNLNSDEELVEVKNKILSFEKKCLFKFLK